MKINIGDVVEVQYPSSPSWNGIRFRVTNQNKYGIVKGEIIKTIPSRAKEFPIGGEFSWGRTPPRCGEGLVVVSLDPDNPTENQVYIDLVDKPVESAEMIAEQTSITKHQFKPGDKVVIRPKDHPGHHNCWYLGLDSLQNRILTVKDVWQNGVVPYLYFEDDPDHHHLATHLATRFEPFEYKFKAGDKVITRPHDHPGHRKRGGDDNLVAYLDNQILTIESVRTGNDGGYVTIEKDPHPFFSPAAKLHWACFASRFMPVPDGFVSKHHHLLLQDANSNQETPNQVYIDHILGCLTQKVTPSELLGLADKLIKIGNERRT